MDVTCKHFSWVKQRKWLWKNENWFHLLLQRCCPKLIKSSLRVPVEYYKGFTASLQLKYLKPQQGHGSAGCFENDHSKTEAQPPKISATEFLITDTISTLMTCPPLSSEQQVMNSGVSMRALQASCLPCCCSFIPLFPYSAHRGSLWASADAHENQEINPLKQGWEGLGFG